MDKKDLQLYTGSTIINSAMTKQAKLQMINFIQHEASESQLMALVLDGRIVKLDEQAKEIVKDRFESYMNQEKQEKVTESIENIKTKISEKTKGEKKK